MQTNVGRACNHPIEREKSVLVSFAVAFVSHLSSFPLLSSSSFRLYSLEPSAFTHVTPSDDLELASRTQTNDLPSLSFSPQQLTESNRNGSRTGQHSNNNGHSKESQRTLRRNNELSGSGVEFLSTNAAMSLLSVSPVSLSTLSSWILLNWIIFHANIQP